MMPMDAGSRVRDGPQGKVRTTEQARGEGGGRPQGGEDPREPGPRPKRGDPSVEAPTGRGSKPLKRGPDRRKPVVLPHVGPGAIQVAGDDGNANRKRGCHRREAMRPQPGQALKGEPRERARVINIGEIVEGARRRSGQEPQGRNMTREVEFPGMVALDGMVALLGKKPRESGAQETHRKVVIVRRDARARLWSGVEA